MKITRLLSIVALVLGASLTSFGQERIASAVSPDNFETSNKNGVYSFELPADVTAKDVALSAEYYTMYFTVSFNEKNHQAVVTLKEKTENAKHIIVRFFISLEIRNIDYNGVNYTIEDFYKKFLQSK